MQCTSNAKEAPRGVQQCRANPETPVFSNDEDAAALSQDGLQHHLSTQIQRQKLAPTMAT